MSWILARTGLVVTAHDEEVRAPHEVVRDLLRRQVPARDAPTPLFEEAAAPSEARELEYAVRDVAGRGSAHARWRVSVLAVRNDVLQRLFRGLRPYLDDDGLDGVFCELTDIRVYVYPLGVSQVVFQLAWTVDAPRDLEIDLTRLADALSHVRHARADDPQRGRENTWTLGTPLGRARAAFDIDEQGRWTEREDGERAVPDKDRWRVRLWRDMPGALRRACGAPAVDDAAGRRHAMDLVSIVDWLLATPEEAQAPPPRADVSRYALPMTAVVVPTLSVDPDTLGRLRFHLRRAARHDYIAPTRPGTFDVELEPRGNRYIGLSRDGVVAWSWVPAEANEDFEVNNWPSRFAGIYSWLALQALAERHVLARLSSRLGRSLAEAADAATNGDAVATDRARQAVEAQLLDHASYTVSLVSEDCGGLAEYAEFFRAMRQVHGTPAALVELREETREAADVVRTMHERVRTRLREEEARRDAQFQVFVAVLGVFGVGLASLTGLMGMNLPDADSPVALWLRGDFWTVAGLVVSVSACLTIAVYRRHQRNAERAEDAAVSESR